MSHIKIALIDDHTLFRSGIKALLSRQNDFEVIGEAADGLSGVKLVAQTRPDIVLLDLDMPVMNGREALAQILSAHPEQTVVMLTVSEDSDDLTECMRLGARGFLLKNINADFLLDSIRKAVDGDNVFSPEMTARLVQSLISPAAPPKNSSRVDASRLSASSRSLIHPPASSAAMPGSVVESSAMHGLDPDFVEAMAFAWLARETLAGRPGNLPAVTGAAGPRVLGAIYPS